MRYINPRYLLTYLLMQLPVPLWCSVGATGIPKGEGSNPVECSEYFKLCMHKNTAPIH